MSDYNEPAYRQAPPESLYPDPSSGYGQQSSGQTSLSLSPRRTPRYSRASNPSWVSNGMLSPPPFGPPSSIGSRPLPAPSPVPSRGMSSDFVPPYLPPDPRPEPEVEAYTTFVPETREEREWEHEAEAETENMTMSMNEDDGDGYTYRAGPQEEGPSEVSPQDDTRAYPVILGEPESEQKKRRFVGGFVAGLKGLRNLPKAVVKSHFYDRKSTRRGAPGTEQPTGPSFYLPPGYTESAAVDPAPTTTSQYGQVTDLPLAKSPMELSPLDTGRRASQPRTSCRSSSRAASSPRFRSPARSPEAVLVEPAPASDYAKMDSPIRTAPPDDSFGAHITRVRKFFRELNSLPWTSDRVALDYFPEESSRAHAGKPSGPWYTVHGHQDLDLLAAPAPAGARTAASRRQHSEDKATVASVRSSSRPRPDMRSPVSYMTSPGQIPSPGASSHGHGHHAMSYSYYFAPPQPLYVYQSPMASPMTHSGTRSSSSSMSREMHPQAVPVYMMAGPPPGLMPSPPPLVHASQHHHPSRAASPPVVVPSGQPPSHPRYSGSNSH